MPGPWALVPGTELLWRQFGDEWVVYDQGSGNTIRLDAWPAAVLGLLEESPGDLDTLQRRLAQAFVNDLGEAPPACGPEPLLQALQQLQQHGLVQTPAG